MVPKKTPSGDGFDVDRFMERRRSLRNEYATYQEQYVEISQNFRPRRGFYLRDTGGAGSNNEKITGAKRNHHIINGTSTRVSKNAQSGLQAGVTSPSRPWKKLGPKDTDILQVPGAAEAYSKLDKLFDAVVAKSNFHQCTHTAYADFCDFGPAALQIDVHPTDTIRCQTHPTGSWVGACNEDGFVDVFYRDYRPTGYELVKRFGKEAIPTGLGTQISRDPYKRYDLTNAIEENPFYVPNSIGMSRFPYLSVWWIKGYEQNFVNVHGYYEFPVMVFRFYKSERNDAYGYGPGMDGLGDAKQLQHQERTKLIGLDQMVRPPLQAPTSLKQKGVSLVSGKVNYHDGPAKVESLYNVNLPLNYVLQDIQEIQSRLSQTYFEDLFLMITNSVTRETTAREIQERHEEKLIMLGPVLESLQDELLDPAVDRILNIMKRQGKWVEFPEQLQGQEIEVEYISILAQAQRAVQTVAIEQGVNFTGALAQLNPAALDRLNVDGTLDEYYHRIGFPVEGVTPIGDAENIRAQRAQQEQREQQLAQAQAAASAVKDAAPALENEAIQPNVLQRIMGT